MNIRFLCYACTAMLTAASLPLATAAEDGIRPSVVKIVTTLRGPSLMQPWTKLAPQESGGTGFVIDGKRILTNHHVVRYASQIYVQPYHSAERFTAQVVVSSPEIDLAILEVESKSFFEGRPPLQIDAQVSRIRSAVNVYGYPIGGVEMSVTEGIVSRIEYTYFSYDGAGLKIQIDAATNPGNSGGPAVADGKGVVFAGMQTAENIGYLIAAEEVQAFLDDVRDGTYDGKPQLLNEFQPTENEALRESLKLPQDVEGCVLTRVTSRRDEDYPLRVHDVVTHIGPHPIDRSGQVRCDGDLRVFFTYFEPKLTTAAQVPLTVFRDGESISLDVPTTTGRERVAPYLKGAYPDYFILGPMVFTTASNELALGLARHKQVAEYLIRIQSPLVGRADDTAQFAGERLVVIPCPLFSHSIAKGYATRGLQVVEQVNGVAVKNLAHLVELVRDSGEEFLEFTFAEKESARFVFRRQELLDSTEEILVDNGIRNQSSPELSAAWEKK